MSAKITKTSDLPPSEAKWISFQKIDWVDQAGVARVWEVASRKTRGSSGIDAVAIAAILRSPTAPPSTIIILQFRPPAAGICVELPAGLIDASETPQQAAVRELREETGYEGKVVGMSPTIVSDPGMTTANMQFATVEVEVKEGELPPVQQLDEGEFIVRVVVPIHELYARLVKYSEEGKTVDARLWHWAAGIEFAKSL
ncbi:ADP-ribose pyrophosphatase [Mytilinidion resinicola]|uniref:ADP-ribose pyrophosphatase n=1 Tax=Mytilinidion resinicola TaxID=574789 RepID=A0A6A6Y945_9PEZI|nr:ADP-ribose pyrophosphatase [Mytilinidion resinicola]KAF2804347.1 ADP-ribose pyrophosphatase [Mytilinidion resinicola]